MSSIASPTVVPSASVPAFVTRAGRDLLYLTIGMASSVVALVVWIAGLTLSLSLAPFVIGLPVIVGTALAFRWVAGLDRRNAAVVDGRTLAARYRDHASQPFLTRLRTTLADGQTWRDLAWLLAHSVLGLAFGILALTFTWAVVGLALLPAWNWTIPGGAQFGLWTADSVWLTFVSALLAVPLAGITALLLRGMAMAEHGLARTLLD